MLIRFSDSEEEYRSYKYDEEEGIFVIDSENKDTQLRCIPGIQVIKEYNPNRFEYVILHNERDNCTENSIFMVTVGRSRSRIGWLFPIQALESNEHKCKDNVYFQRYAYIAYCLLLEDINDLGYRQFNSEIKLSDYYGDDIHLLIIDHDNTATIENYNLDDYIVSLFEYGYSFSGKGNLISNVSYSELIKLNLLKLPTLLQKISAIPVMFKTSIVREYNAEFSRFYAYYQLIEILISVVFDEELKHFVTILSKDNKKLFELKDKLNDITTERKRVVWLISNYSRISSELSTGLNSLAIKLLVSNGKQTKDSMADNLYSTRCLLVHELYRVDESSENTLRELNDLFLDLILEILKTFKSPYSSDNNG